MGFSLFFRKFKIGCWEVRNGTRKIAADLFPRRVLYSSPSQHNSVDKTMAGYCAQTTGTKKPT
ncbi:hypothetical protein EAY27_24875, partial [Vibrio anguillarum]|nr:hypothetical protein [Vibrio anguillarum]